MLSPQGHIEHAAGVVDDGETTWLLTETPIALRRLAEPHEVHAARRDRRRDRRLGRASVSRSTPRAPPTSRSPGATRGRRTAPGGTRYGPADDEHPGADRDWRLVLVPARPAGRGGRARGRRRAGRSSAPGPARPRASRRGGRGRPTRSTTAPSRTSSTGCAPRCTCTRAATAGRRRSRACTTSGGRRAGSSCCTWTARGTCCPRPARGARRGPHRDVAGARAAPSGR